MSDLKGTGRKGRWFAAAILLTALVAAGCASERGATGVSGLLNFTNDAVTGSSTETPIESLDKGLEIGVAADSWPELVRKTKPTFAWNGCDLMWIETGEAGCPRFIMDEAYTYKPGIRREQKVLLVEDPMLRESYSDPTDGRNLRGIAELRETIPDTLIENGRGDYAVAIATHPEFGTVYEIGWQRAILSGTGCFEFGRRLYVWRDGAQQWHFLCEGPEEGTWRDGYLEIKTSVVWEQARNRTNGFPLRIEFRAESTESEPCEIGMEQFAKPDVTRNEDWVLAGDFPAQVKRRSERDYVLAEKGDTLEKIVKRLGAWEPETGFDYGGTKEAKRMEHIKEVLSAWRGELSRLNPKLPRNGQIVEGTRVELLTQEEFDKMLRRFKDG